jgi:hypothetical protein
MIGIVQWQIRLTRPPRPQESAIAVSVRLNLDVEAYRLKLGKAIGVAV